MALIQSSRYCRQCGRNTLHQTRRMTNTAGCLLSVVTLGIFLPLWLMVGVYEGLCTKWTCQTCGKGRRT